MGSFLRYNDTLFQFFRNFYKNLNFFENSEICIFLSKLTNLSLNFGLMLTKTSLIVFIIFVGQLGYIVMSDSEKIKIFIFWKKEDLRLFLVAKSEKTYKKYFSHQPVLVRNGFLNRGPFAELESTIRPLSHVRLIKSAVAPILTVSSHSSHHPQEVLLAQFSLHLHKGGLNPFFISFPRLVSSYYYCYVVGVIII